MVKVVLAYSGGLDTSVAIRWLKERGFEVIAFTANVGQNADLEVVREKALKIGAAKAYLFDLREEFVNKFIFPALKANALYQGQYPLSSALSRPLIAQKLVEIAEREGAGYVAHGCTGKGNDQVRFEVSIMALAPHLKIIAPAREWGMGRDETIKYAQRHGIPIPATVGSPYSIDENLWGRSIECGVLEEPEAEPPEDVFSLTRPVLKTPDEPQYIEIGFEGGLPVSLNGERTSGLKLIQMLNEIGGFHGVGRIDHIEDRLVGIKSREVYEAPAAEILIKAHRALEALTLSKDQIRFKEMVSQEYAEIVYNGLWFSAHRQDLDAYIESTQRYVTGKVRVKLYRGGAVVVGRSSPYSIYSQELATYEKGDIFDHKASSGFIYIWGLPLKIQSQKQPPRQVVQ